MKTNNLKVWFVCGLLFLHVPSYGTVLFTENWNNGIDTTRWNISQGNGAAEIVSVSGAHALKMSGSGYNTNIYTVDRYLRGRNLTVCFSAWHDRGTAQNPGFNGPFHLTDDPSGKAEPIGQTIECGLDRLIHNGVGGGLRWAESGGYFYQNGPDVQDALNTAWVNAVSRDTAVGFKFQLGDSSGGRGWFNGNPITTITGNAIDTRGMNAGSIWNGNVKVSGSKYVHLGFGPCDHGEPIYITDIELSIDPLATPAPNTVITGEAMLMPSGTMETSQTIPDTLDLAERAKLALHGLGDFLNDHPGRYAEPFGQAFFGVNPPLMTNNPKRGGGGPPNWGKIAHAFIYARKMAGTTTNLDKQLAMTRNMIDASLPPDINIVLRSQFGCPLSRAMLALMDLYKQSGGAGLKTMIDDMASIQRSGLRYDFHKGDYAYYANWPPMASQPLLGYVDNMHEEGTMVVALSTYGALFKGVSPDACVDSIKAAQGTSRFLLTPAFWQSEAEPKAFDGSGHEHFCGHIHSYEMAMQGFITCLEADPRQPWLGQAARQAYEYMRNVGIARIGLFGESCAVGDMTVLAVKLSELGYGDYWDDVDSYVRNHLAEVQVTDPDRLQTAVSGMPANKLTIDPVNETTDNVCRRNLGCFLSDDAHPTRIPNDAVDPIDSTFAWTICCTGNCWRGMYEAWDGIVQFGNGCATVNLLLNRSSKWCNVDSYLPYEGKVVIKVKNGTDSVHVRIPNWAPAGDVTGKVNDKTVSNKWAGRYLLFLNLNAGDRIEIDFPIYTRTESHVLKWKDAERYAVYEGMIPYSSWQPGSQVYKITFAGNTVVDIAPRSTAYPGYDLYRATTERPAPGRIGSTCPTHVIDRFSCN